jgi:hypothetical protein
MCGTVYVSGRHVRPGFGGDGHEIVVTLCRAFSYRYLVNFVAVRPKRYGSIANRNRLRHPASYHQGRSAEAGGKATQAEAGGKHSCISPDIATHSSGIGTANRSEAGACERFSNGEACRARENLQQLRRWLRNKLEIRQPTLEWMLYVG